MPRVWLYYLSTLLSDQKSLLLNVLFYQWLAVLIHMFIHECVLSTHSVKHHDQALVDLLAKLIQMIFAGQLSLRNGLYLLIPSFPDSASVSKFLSMLLIRFRLVL